MRSIRPQPSALLHSGPPLRATTPVRCGFGLPWLLLTKADSTVGFARQSYGWPKPEPRGARQGSRASASDLQKQVALTASTARACADLCASRSRDAREGSTQRLFHHPAQARGKGDGVAERLALDEPRFVEHQPGRILNQRFVGIRRQAA